MDKSVETFCKTNAFKLTIIPFFWIKTHFSSIVNPLHPKQCCKTLRWCLFVSNIEKGGRGGYLSRLERGEFTTRENMMIISICLNNFCPWLLLLYKRFSLKKSLRPVDRTLLSKTSHWDNFFYGDRKWLWNVSYSRLLIKWCFHAKA